jgi:Icc-related predicted phosphoesterase
MFWVKLKLAAAWCRQYWRWLVFVIAVLVSYILGKKDKDKLKEQAKLAKDMYVKEKEVIERAHQQELKKKEEAQQRYADAVDKIEEQYEKDQWNITHAKKEAVKSMVNKAKNDPDEVDRILEEELGIKKRET